VELVQSQVKVKLPKADIFGKNLEVSFGIEFEFYPNPPRPNAWIPADWKHQEDRTAGEEIATPVLILDFSNPIKLIKSYAENRRRVFLDLHEYAKRNSCTNYYLSSYRQYQSMGGHIHVSLPSGIDYARAEKIATYIKSVLPLTAFLGQFDPFSKYSRRIMHNIAHAGFCRILPEGKFISAIHYGMISYNPIRTVEIRVQDSAPPQVLLPIAYIYCTLFASALKSGRTSPRDYLAMTEYVHQHEMKLALLRKLRMAKVAIRWMALCRGDVPLPRDVAYLVWLALNRIAPMDYARDVGLRDFYTACEYVPPSGKGCADNFLVLVRTIYDAINDPTLKSVYNVFVSKFDRKTIVWLSDVLKLYAKTTVDVQERTIIDAFLSNRKTVKNKLIIKCMKMTFREEWDRIPLIYVRRIGENPKYSREDDAEWIYNTIHAEDLNEPRDVIQHRDRFYIIEDKERRRIGVIRVAWQQRTVRGVWLTRELREGELRELKFELRRIASWFADAVLKRISST